MAPFSHPLFKARACLRSVAFHVGDVHNDDDADDGAFIVDDSLWRMGWKLWRQDDSDLSGADVINKLALLWWNNAPLLEDSRHMTFWTNQSALFHHSIATFGTIKYVLEWLLGGTDWNCLISFKQVVGKQVLKIHEPLQTSFTFLQLVPTSSN